MDMRRKEDKIREQNEFIRELIIGLDQIKEGKTMPFDKNEN